MIFELVVCTFLPPHAIDEDVLRRDLLTKITVIHDKGIREKHVIEIGQQLQATFDSLPKLRDRHVSTKWASFLLNRYFHNQHSWSVTGVDPRGGEHSDSLPALIEDYREVFGANDQYTLHDIAMMAAIMERIVLQDVPKVLSNFIEAAALASDPSKVRLNKKNALAVVGQFYMYALRNGLDPKIGSNDVSFIFNKAGALQYPLKLPLGLRENLEDYLETHFPYASMKVSMHELTEMAHIAIDWKGNTMHKICHDWKTALMEMEDGISGRVPLETFYTKRQHGTVMFRESRQYLEMSGSIDIREPNRNRVIIANYLAAPTNCIMGSGYHRVCCADECESLMQHIETQIAAPSADVDVILSIVANLSSPTVPSPVSISAILQERLWKIAYQHDGKVPLHSRLFAQWMHNVYPHECRFPHAAGTTSHLTKEEYKISTGSVHYINTSSIEEIAGQLVAEEAPHGTTYWNDHEELPDEIVDVGKHSLGKVMSRLSQALILCAVTVALFSILPEVMAWHHPHKSGLTVKML